MIRPLLLVLTLGAAALAYEPPSPTHDVEIVRYEWHDDARNRDVPVKIYYPKDLTTPSPVVLFSHGLGGSRENYEYLGRHWAGSGFVSVHLQHNGSDDAVWKEAEPGKRMNSLVSSAMKLSNSANRPRDISFAIDQLTRANSDKSSPLRGRLDLAKIGVAGHSYGGFTAMAIAGQAFGPRRSREMADPRVKAVIQMSAPVPLGDRGADAAYNPITTPVFHMTGTKDDSPIGDTSAAQRRIPFDHMTSAETCLLIFKNGDHMVFAGAPRLSPAARESDIRFQREICAASTAWWEAHLRGSAAAREWLMDGGFAGTIGGDGTFEVQKEKK
jgi:dienelactone hydrolase